MVELKDAHKGEKCYIIGCGPSLNDTEFSHIEKWTALIGVNDIYLGFEKFGISCKYYVVSKPFWWKKHGDDFFDFDKEVVLFVSEEIAKMFDVPTGCFIYRTIGDMLETGRFSTDLKKGVFGCDCVIVDCLQIAYWLGFYQVFLLGCDFDYSGWARWNVPFKKEDKDRSKVFKCFRICKKVFEKDYRLVYNATFKSKLDVFEKIRMSNL